EFVKTFVKIDRSGRVCLMLWHHATALLFVRDAAAICFLVLEAVSIHEEDILLAAFCFVLIIRTSIACQLILIRTEQPMYTNNIHHHQYKIIVCLLLTYEQMHPTISLG
ncbi:hypothetical protein ACJX0J_010179, partial [Zea mays]